MAKRGKSPKDTLKGPRLRREDRLVRRFYEPLVLLNILDRNSEQRIYRCPSQDNFTQLQPQELRRTFLGQLAYVCDYAKGGDTVTAIALQGQPSGVTFWVASNKNMSDSTIFFLRGILNTLHNIASSHSQSSELENELAKRCIKFNLCRLKTYQDFMRKNITRCLELLSKSKASNDKALAEWLAKFLEFKPDIPSLCYFSYEQRRGKCMRELQRHIGEENSTSNTDESKQRSFLLARHYIGRLGSHLKAAKILVMAGQRLPNLFDSFSVEVHPSPRPPVLPPPVDQSTTLSGILKRMLPKDSEDTPRYEKALQYMDTKFNLLGRLRDQYQDKDFRPRVHVEIHLLEYFYKQNLAFFDDDRFIGCSKPACYCCYHYISHHPGGFVRPDSHGIRYISWRSPDIVDPEDQKEKNHQRDILNKVIEQIRLDTFRQIEQRVGPSPWRPDSTTGITISQQYNNDLDSLKGGMNSLSISEDLYPDLDSSPQDDEDSDSDGGVLLQMSKL